MREIGWIERERGGPVPVRVRVRIGDYKGPTTTAMGTNSSDNNHNSNRHEEEEQEPTKLATKQSLLKVSTLRNLIFAANTCFIGIWCAAGGGRPPTPPPPRILHFISKTRACHEINILV